MSSIFGKWPITLHKHMEQPSSQIDRLEYEIKIISQMG